MLLWFTSLKPLKVSSINSITDNEIKAYLDQKGYKKNLLHYRRNWPIRQQKIQHLAGETEVSETEPEGKKSLQCSILCSTAFLTQGNEA